MKTIKTIKKNFYQKVGKVFKQTKKNAKMKADLIKILSSNNYDNRALTLLLDVAKNFAFKSGNVVEDYILEQEVEVKKKSKKKCVS